jgi:NhaP-type Na+/H+ or K+/H+ antiporter
MEPIDRWTILHFAFESIFFLFIFLQIDCIEDLKIEKKDKTEVCFRPPIYIVSYLSLPNNIWRLIVFAPFLIIIIIILVLSFLSVHHELIHGRSQELQDRISWNLVEL